MHRLCEFRQWFAGCFIYTFPESHWRFQAQGSSSGRKQAWLIHNAVRQSELYRLCDSGLEQQPGHGILTCSLSNRSHLNWNVLRGQPQRVSPVVTTSGWVLIIPNCQKIDTWKKRRSFEGFPFLADIGSAELLSPVGLSLLGLLEMDTKHCWIRP